MAFPNGSSYMTVVRLASTKRPNLGICHPFPTPYFEHLHTTIPYLVNAALNIPGIPVAILINGFVFPAVRRSTVIRLASKLLLLALVLTDFQIGLLLQPAFLVLLFMKADGTSAPDCSLLKVVHFTSTFLTSVLLFTMTAISLDRYVAVFFHVKYHQLVTTKRVAAVLVSIWSVSLFHACVSLVDTKLETILFAVFTLACIAVLSVACMKIHRRLRHQYGPGAQVGDEAQVQQQAGSTLSIARYKQTASAMMWIYTLLVLCYLPNLCVRLVEPDTQYKALAQCIQEFCFTLLLFNASLNPVVYFLHLPGIRAEVLKQVPKLCF